MTLSAFFVDRCHKDGFSVFMSPEKMAQLSFREGQIVRIKSQTKESLLVKLYSSKEECPISNIQVPLSVRKNIHTYLGQTVIVEAAEKVANAEVVIFSAVSETVEGIDGALVDLLFASNYEFVGMPVRRGMVIPVYALNRVIEFKVVSCSPDAEVIIKDKEIIAYRDSSINRENINFSLVSYDSLGGVNKEIGQIRKLIEIPLLQPKFIASFGVRPTSGILITGPSGSGKSYIAKAISNETPCYFEYIKGIDLLTRPPADAAFIIKRIVDRVLEKTPAIIFIDDIDLICQPIYFTDNAADNHLSNALLSAIDRCVDHPNVVFIGTAKSPESIPKDFRRGRRLDKIVNIPLPDQAARTEIIRCSIRNTLLSSATTPEDLVEGTDGLTAGDLARTCQMALMHRAMEIVQQQTTDSDFSIETLQSIVVGKKRFQKLLPQRDPNAVRMDPFGANRGSDPFGGMQSNKSADPFGGMQNKNFDDPFAGMNANKGGASPFGGAPNNNDDPFGGASSKPKSVDPFGDMSAPKKTDDDPFGDFRMTPKQPPKTIDPFGAAPAAAKGSDPFGGLGSDPFSAPKKAEPKTDDMFGAPPKKPASDPFGGADSDPFGAPKAAAAPKNDDPFGAPQKPAASDPFGGASSDPFAPKKAAAPKNDDPFGADPFGAPQQKQAADPFANMQKVDLKQATIDEKNKQAQQAHQDPAKLDPFAPRKKK